MQESNSLWIGLDDDTDDKLAVSKVSLILFLDSIVMESDLVSIEREIEAQEGFWRSKLAVEETGFYQHQRVSKLRRGILVSICDIPRALTVYNRSEKPKTSLELNVKRPSDSVPPSHFQIIGGESVEVDIKSPFKTESTQINITISHDPSLWAASPSISIKNVPEYCAHEKFTPPANRGLNLNTAQHALIPRQPTPASDLNHEYADIRELSDNSSSEATTSSNKTYIIETGILRRQDLIQDVNDKLAQVSSILSVLTGTLADLERQMKEFSLDQGGGQLERNETNSLTRSSCHEEKVVDHGFQVERQLIQETASTTVDTMKSNLVDPESVKPERPGSTPLLKMLSDVNISVQGSNLKKEIASSLPEQKSLQHPVGGVSPKISDTETFYTRVSDWLEMNSSEVEKNLMAEDYEHGSDTDTFTSSFTSVSEDSESERPSATFSGRNNQDDGCYDSYEYDSLRPPTMLAEVAACSALINPGDEIRKSRLATFAQCNPSKRLSIAHESEPLVTRRPCRKSEAFFVPVFQGLAKTSPISRRNDSKNSSDSRPQFKSSQMSAQSPQPPLIKKHATTSIDTSKTSTRPKVFSTLRKHVIQNMASRPPHCRIPVRIR